ncbi:hypothetical protein C8R45DRAFT_985542 [Mycena sanguinolenta]|nr:hypothetical protein C8R45DRAFT_985542 [Mycena sanguinolenta]
MPPWPFPRLSTRTRYIPPTILETRVKAHVDLHTQSNATLTPSETISLEFSSGFDSGWFPEPSTPTQRLNAGLAAAVGSARLPKRSAFKSLLLLGRRKAKPPISIPMDSELPRIEQADFDLAPIFDKSDLEPTITNTLPSLPSGSRPPRKSKSMVFRAKGKDREPVREAEPPDSFEAYVESLDEIETDSQSPPASSTCATFSEARTSTETLVPTGSRTTPRSKSVVFRIKGKDDAAIAAPPVPVPYEVRPYERAQVNKKHDAWRMHVADILCL